MLVGATYIGVPLAIFFSNAGGLADNAKKRFEANLVAGLTKDMPEYISAHDAAVVGDTMGDWMKDVVAVSIDIFIKIMGTLALMLAPMFAQYQLLPF
jgi:K(+)-stimulated pyrophosphate-energized sodium pump